MITRTALDRLFSPPQIVFFVLLLLVAFISRPSSFEFSWNEGLAGLIITVPLAAIELGRESFASLGRERAVGCYIVLLLAGAYYSVASQAYFVKYLTGLAVGWGVSQVIAQYSWVSTVDYAFSTIFVSLICYLGSRPVTPWVYTAGMTSFLFTDTVLPYNALGPFQYLVPPLLQAVSFLVNLSGAGNASSSGNTLHLSNSYSSMSLVVYWPSAGLHGMVIAVLAVVAVSVKLRTGWRSGAVYVILGLAGSVVVNTIRIALLAIYALYIGASPDAFEAFHSVIGELLFIPWIAGYIYWVIKRESCRLRKPSLRPTSHADSLVERQG
jgi:thaumarchaeosortase